MHSMDMLNCTPSAVSLEAMLPDMTQFQQQPQQCQ